MPAQRTVRADVRLIGRSSKQLAVRGARRISTSWRSSMLQPTPSSQAMKCSGCANGLRSPGSWWTPPGRRLGELNDDEVTVLVLAFELDWFGDETAEPAFAAVNVTTTILDVAPRQVARHALRACGAVQLATALAVRAVDPHVDAVAAFDAGLRSAAASEGFSLLPHALDSAG